MVSRPSLRPSKLDSARTAARESVQASVRRMSGASGGHTTIGVLVAVEQPPTFPKTRAEVQVGGGRVWLPADPGGYVIGGSVYVLVDGAGRPYRVTGPTGVPVPGSSVPTTPGQGAVPVVIQPDLSIDPVARQRSSDVADGLDDARDELGAAQDWISETGEGLVAGLSDTGAAVDTVGDLLNEVRDRVGTKRWVGTTEFVGPTFIATPIGDGRLRLESTTGNVQQNSWHAYGQGQGATPSAVGAIATMTFPASGLWQVRLESDGVNGPSDERLTVTVTPDMMGPDYGWADIEFPDVDWSSAEIGLGQLRDAGLLDPDVWAALYQDVVVGGVVGATEAFVGQNAIIDNAIYARHVTASESMSAKLAQFLTVTTDMLLVGGMNRLPDPRFQDADLTVGRESRSSSTYWYYVPSTSADSVKKYGIPVEPGEQYRVTIPISGGGTGMARVEFWDEDGTGRVYSTSNVSDETYEDDVLSYVITVPEGCYYAGIVTYRTTSYTVNPGATVTLMTDSRLIVDGGVTARHLNVLAEESGGARLSIQPDGLRMWRPGNTGQSPNITVTTGDGFRVQRDDGTGLLWIDPTTGDLHTDGNIISSAEIHAPSVTAGTFTGSTFRTSAAYPRVVLDSDGLRSQRSFSDVPFEIDAATGNVTVNDGTISGSAFLGGEIDIVDPAGAPVLHASPSEGVAVGGEAIINTLTGMYSSQATWQAITQPVTVIPGRTYRVRFTLERSQAFPVSIRHALWISAADESQATYITGLPSISVIGESEPMEMLVTIPDGMTEVLFSYRTATSYTLQPDQYTQYGDVTVTALGAGNVRISGAVEARRGSFEELQATLLRGPSGIAYDPTDSGWLPFDLTANWVPASGYSPQRRMRGDMVYLRGELDAISASSLSRITTLPSGWRPTQRVRVPWGWQGDTWVEVLPDGQVRASAGSRTSSPGMSLAAIPPFSTT